MGNFISMITNLNTQNLNLIYAVKNGDLDNVVQCLERGANIEDVDQFGATALILASGRGYQDIVELLLARDPNIDAVDDFGETALIWAAMNGHQTIVELLLNHGANIDAADECGETAVIGAARNGHQTIVESLIYRGADINAADHLGNTAISCAAKRFFLPEHQNDEKNDYQEIFKLLVENKAEIDAKTQVILDEKDTGNNLKQYIDNARECAEGYIFK